MTASDTPSSMIRMTPTSTEDSRLYELVHEALSHGTRDRVERREGDRGDFACVQLVAPYAGGPLPDQADFCHVDCCDLSTSGFSFVTETAPETDRLVVALGRAPFQFFIAEIVHRKPLVSEARRAYRVGCQFRQRLGR